MFMYSNGPVSTRRALTTCASRSGVRSETQLHTVPFSSGYMVRRNRTVSPSRSSTVASAYSLKSVTHDGTSLVMSQTRSTGAPITMEFSVWPAPAGAPTASSTAPISWPNVSQVSTSTPSSTPYCFSSEAMTLSRPSESTSSSSNVTAGRRATSPMSMFTPVEVRTISPSSASVGVVPGICCIPSMSFGAAAQTARTTSAAVNPSNPRATSSAVRTRPYRAARTRSMSQPGARRDPPYVGGMTPSLMVSSAATTSSGGPPAYSRPYSALGTVTGTPRGPHTAASASASRRSASGTPAPSAKTTSTPSGPAPAAASAPSIARRSVGGRPEPGRGSNDAEYPAISPYGSPAPRASASSSFSRIRMAPPSPST